MPVRFSALEGARIGVWGAGRETRALASRLPVAVAVADLAVGLDIAVFTNLYPEHLDWHGSHEQYFADKLRLAELARACVVNACDARLRSIAGRPYGCAGTFTVDGDRVLRDGVLVTG